MEYPTIAKALASLPADTAYLDGELCGVLPDGRTAFNLIQNTEGSLIFFLFDLLFLGGENLMTLPLIERKGRLEKLLADAPDVLATPIIKSATDRSSTDWPANMVSKESCRSASMAGLTGAPC